MTLVNETAVKAIIERMGQPCNVLRASNTSTDAYRNKKKTWNPVGTFTVARSYPYLRLWPGQEDTLAGEIDEDNPVLMFARDADIQDGDRIVYDGTEYTVRSITELPTHRRAEAQKI